MAESKRIGALLPATNPVVEPDFYRVIPKEITVHEPARNVGSHEIHLDKEGG